MHFAAYVSGIEHHRQGNGRWFARGCLARESRVDQKLHYLRCLRRIDAKGNILYQFAAQAFERHDTVKAETQILHAGCAVGELQQLPVLQWW